MSALSITEGKIRNNAHSDPQVKSAADRTPSHAGMIF